MRAIGYAGPDGLRVLSRNDRDITASYPDVDTLELAAAGAGGVELDGKLVALDERGCPDFERIQ